jgi:hypothetical protein
VQSHGGRVGTAGIFLDVNTFWGHDDRRWLLGIGISGDCNVTIEAEGDSIEFLEEPATGELWCAVWAQYRFDGSAKDGAGGTDGIVHGATPTTNRLGSPKSAYSFDGASSYIEVPGSIPESAAMSFSVWITMPPAGGNQGLFFAGRSQTDFDWAAWFSAYSPSAPPDLVFAVKGRGSAMASFTEPTAVPAGQWMHVVGIADVPRHRFNFWINGVRHGGVPLVGSEKLPARYNLNIGRGIDPSGKWTYFNGKIADLRFFQRALSAAEIAGLGLEMGAKLTRILPHGSFGESFKLAFQSGKNQMYSVEGSADFRVWVERARVAGTGAEATISLSPLEDEQFFRVRGVDVE